MANPYHDTANKTWKIKVKTEDGWKPQTLGPGEYSEEVPEHILKLAEPFMRKTNAKPKESETNNSPTVNAYCDLYQRRYLKRQGSITRLGCVLAHFRRYCDRHNIKLLSQIGIKEINGFVDFRREKAVNSTICSDLASLQGMFRMACEEKILPENPVKSPANKVREALSNEHANADDDDLHSEIKYYTREQQARYFKALDMFGTPKYADAVRLMLATGMRVSALLAMEFKWLNEEGYIRIPRRHDKGKTGYTTHLFGQESKDIIARRLEHYKEGKVFPEIGASDQLYNYLQRFVANRRHGLTDLVDMGSYCHAWRHTFATNMVEDRMSIEVLQQFMGHHSIKITQRYAKVSNDALFSAVAMIEARMNKTPIA